jgi:exopolysaccharide production protein ExoZ
VTNKSWGILAGQLVALTWRVILTKLYNLQYLRGVAAISVLLFHLGERYSLPFKIGSAGVDIFFVISGFIMWVTTSGRRWTPLEFMSRRIARIVPLYWIVTLATSLAIIFKPQFFFHNNLSVENFLGSLLFVPSSYGDEFHPVVIQGWTLVYEMFFYIIFAICLVFPKNIRIWAINGFLFSLVLAYPILPPGIIRTLSNPLLLEFCAGLTLGWLWTGRMACPLWLGAALLVAGILYLAVIDHMAPGLPRIVRWGLPAALIVAGGVFLELKRPAPPIYLANILGDASYSVYIWHVLLLIVLDAVFLRFHFPFFIQLPLLLFSSMTIVVVLYFLIEKPISNFLHNVIFYRRVNPQARH